MIRIRNLTFEYFDRDDDGNLTEMINAIRGINFDAKKGDFIAVAGKNGSGKSTFAKILNRLLVPIEGSVVIAGKDAMDADNTIEIRKKVGMVFQNPDDQIIGSVVGEDVAFGAENLGVSENRLWERVLDAIDKAGLVAYRDAGEAKSSRISRLKAFAARRINELSGGEKQKVAVAGVLAMQPECIVLDEATSMLDSRSRYEILKVIQELNKKLGITVIMITHLMDELLLADNIYILHQGRLAMRGRRDVIFSNPGKLLELGLECPEIVDIVNELYNEKVISRRDIYSVDGLVAQIKLEHRYSFKSDIGMQKCVDTHTRLDPVNAILLDRVSYSYGSGKILKDISFGVAKGEYTAIIGASGSGKSTLLQHIPGLLKPQNGSVYVDGIDIWDKSTDIRQLRCKTGYVFQYPEQQLFAKNVYEDVVFGPRNVGISEIEAEKRAYESIQLVGLSDDIYDIPIHKLSGGQRRRVALAGVLAMKPEYLILDEPVAGLDPEGRRNMLGIIDMLHREAGITIIMVSHDIESVAAYADRVIVLENGGIKYDGKPEQVFYRTAYEWLSEDGFAGNIPLITELLVKLRKTGLAVDCFAAKRGQGIANIIRALSDN